LGGGDFEAGVLGWVLTVMMGAGSLLVVLDGGDPVGLPSVAADLPRRCKRILRLRQRHVNDSLLKW